MHKHPVQEAKEARARICNISLTAELASEYPFAILKRMHSLQSGDHICSLYSTSAELIAVVAPFLAEGLRRGERCWYVGRADEHERIVAALRKRHVDVDACVQRGALYFAAGTEAYLLQGQFDPEQTLAIFNDVIDEASRHAFSGFRAAAEMSWALTVPEGLERVIVYEALLKSLFRSARATGLCLYPQRTMPLQVLNGALVTHPIVGIGTSFQLNQFYEPNTTRLPAVSDKAVWAKLHALHGDH